MPELQSVAESAWQGTAKNDFQTMLSRLLSPPSSFPFGPNSTLVSLCGYNTFAAAAGYESLLDSQGLATASHLQTGGGGGGGVHAKPAWMPVS